MDSTQLVYSLGSFSHKKCGQWIEKKKKNTRRKERREQKRRKEVEECGPAHRSTIKGERSQKANKFNQMIQLH